MRNASQDYRIVINEEGNEFLGIALGYDYCAEHEWGIEDLRSRFGIPKAVGKKWVWYHEV